METKKELTQEIEKQRLFKENGGKDYEYGPDPFPPSPFIIWSRIKLADRRHNETWGPKAGEEACKEWALFSDETKKPWIAASEQMQQMWRGT